MREARDLLHGDRLEQERRLGLAAVDGRDRLVRAPTVAQVAQFAERGETMPQKSTFFYPKLTSGLLLFPV